MAQRSARRDRDNQCAPPYLEYAAVIWTRSANSHTGPRQIGRASCREKVETSEVAASLKRKFPLPGRGRPQMVTVALANKTARIVWALLVKGGVYRPPAPAA